MSAAGCSSSPGAGMNWPTPSAALTNDQESPESWQARADRIKQKGINGNGAGMPLTVAAKAWPTPTTPSGGPNSGRENRGAGGPDLQETASMWPTPQSRDYKGAPHDLLQHNTRPLNEVAKTWATPTSGDAKSSGSRNTDQSNAHPGLSLTDQVRMDGGTGRSIHQDRTSASAGPQSSPTHQNSPQLSLNPTFVEWLMGWPPGWTDCGSPVMGFTPWLQRQRFELYALRWNYAPTSGEPEMLQMEMF